MATIKMGIPNLGNISQKFSKSSTAKTGFATVIEIDPAQRAFHFYTITNGVSSTPVHERKNYKSKLYDKEFFVLFTNALEEYVTQYPAEKNIDVTIILPDCSVCMDSVAVATMNKKKTDDALDVVIEGLFKNRNELKINTIGTASNKQFTTYAVSAIKQEIINEFYAACATTKVIPTCITFASNSTINGASALVPKLKNDTYLLMDIKPDDTRWIFVVKGRTAGFFPLPFGYSMLYHSKLAAEDMLFDHSQAELLVVNAKEKAKAKQQSMGIMENENASIMGQEIDESEADGDSNDTFVDDVKDDEQPEEDSLIESNQTNIVGNYTKVLPKKTPRKLPKNMLRDVPSDGDGYYYENFRIFVKWALNLIQDNGRILGQNNVENVYVNLPEQYSVVFDITNKEEKENKAKFHSLGLYEGQEELAENLELYGGFFDNPNNKVNNF